MRKQTPPYHLRGGYKTVSLLQSKYKSKSRNHIITPLLVSIHYNVNRKGGPNPSLTKHHLLQRFYPNVSY